MGIDKSSSEWLFFHRHGSWLRKKRSLRNFYRNLITTEDMAYPGFAGKLRLLALEVLNEKGDFPNLHMALCILSVVGTENDIPLIESINEIGNEDLSIDVKTCIYEIKYT